MYVRHPGFVTQEPRLIDYHELQMVMRTLGRRWGDQVPSIEEIELVCAKLVAEMQNDPGLLSAEMGGLRAYRDENDNVRVCFVLDVATNAKVKNSDLG
jgi:hypothetical protein